MFLESVDWLDLGSTFMVEGKRRAVLLDAREDGPRCCWFCSAAPEPWRRKTDARAAC